MKRRKFFKALVLSIGYLALKHSIDKPEFDLTPYMAANGRLYGVPIHELADMYILGGCRVGKSVFESNKVLSIIQKKTQDVT